MKIIVISGKAQHGKDTLAGYLKEIIESEEKKVLIVHFADYLKFVCQKYFDWDGKKDEKGRTILQYVGTDLIRKKIPSFWAKTVCELAVALESEYDYFIIPDCRFPDEIDLPKQYKFKTTAIRIKRCGPKNNFDNGLTEEQKKHISECSLDDYGNFDHIIQNNLGLDDLKQSAKALYFLIKKEIYEEEGI